MTGRDFEKARRHERARDAREAEIARKASSSTYARKRQRERMIRRRRSNGYRCTRCTTGALLERRRRTDGARFLGCSNYPDCSYTEAMRN